MNKRTASFSIDRGALVGIALAAFICSSDLRADDRPGGPNTVGETPSLLEIREWLVPWANTRPRDPDKAPDGSVWFVGQIGNYVARFDPDSGAMKRFEIPGAGPHTVVVDSDGYPWYAGN